MDTGSPWTTGSRAEIAWDRTSSPAGYGLAASLGLVIPLPGLASAIGLALFAGHRRTLRVLSVLAGLSVLVLLVMSGTFVLDVLQVRRQMRLEAQTNVAVASAHALLKMGLVVTAKEVVH